MYPPKRRWAVLLITALLASGCAIPPFGKDSGSAVDKKPTSTTIVDNKSDITSTPGNKSNASLLRYILTDRIQPPEIPGSVSYAFLNYDCYRYDDPTLKSHAESLVEGCGDDECKVHHIHKYVIDNFYYKEYGNSSRKLGELFNTRYGVCRDFAVFYYNYLKSLGIESYTALLEDHTYALPCNLNLTKLQGYIEDDPNFKNFTRGYTLSSFEFEVNQVFNRTCLRLEGPGSKKGTYRYPGEHYDDTPIVENKSFFIDPETKRWGYIDESDITVKESRAHLERHFNFAMSKNSDITWTVQKITKKFAGGVDYEFEVPEVIMTTRYYYATFTLPEASRHDRIKVRITVEGTNPFIFYTLQDESQLNGFIYGVEHPLEVRKDYKPHSGNLPWEFIYIGSCSQGESAAFFERECILPDAGRRVFVIHNPGYFKTNNINVTVKYLEFYSI